MRRINLMQIVFTLEIGGLEYLVLNLVRKLDKAKYNISICSLSAKGKLEDKFIEMGVKVYHIEKRRGIDYSVYFKLAGLLRKNKIDIIHTHNPAPWFYGVIAGKLAGVKAAIHTEHSYLFAEQRRLMLAERLLSRITEAVVSDSNKVKDFFVKKLGIPEERIKTVVNGIDVDKFKNMIDVRAKKTELGIKEDSLVIGNVARLEPVKNHLYLLDVFSRVSHSFPRAVLVIVGGGSQTDILKIKTAELGIKDKIFFLGVRDDISDLLRIFDIFALTSINEGISLSILEAMAAGKPVVAT
ncbi:MAG: glycosyltransferase, partial [Actinomycetota bacterium]